MKDEDAYPLDTVLRWKKTGEFVLVKKKGFQKDGRGFLHYLCQIDGKGPELYAIYHDEVDLECLPPNET
jgi:hypothetical protein